MSETKNLQMIANNLVPAIAVHPGEIIREELEFRGISQRELARATGVSPTIINEFIKGKRGLGTELALLLGAALDLDAEPLLELQTRYDIFKAKSNPAFQKKLTSAMCLRETSLA